MAQVHGKAGKSTYLKGDRLLHWALFPMLGMGFLTYILFRVKSWPAGLLQIIIGCLLFGLGCWCAIDVLSLEAAADRYYGGAGGEQDVGLVLARLPQEFHVFNGLGFDFGDVDHVVVGPTGIFVVETKNHGGTISQRGSRLCRNGIALGRDFIRQANREAMYVKCRLSPQVQCHVRPVVVFARAKVRVRSLIDGVRVIPLSSLTESVTARATCLSRDDIEHYVQCLEAARLSAVREMNPRDRMPVTGITRMLRAGAAHPGFVRLSTAKPASQGSGQRPAGP